MLAWLAAWYRVIIAHSHSVTLITARHIGPRVIVTKIMKQSPTGSPFKFFVLVFSLSLPFWIIQLLLGGSGLPLDIPITDILAVFVPLGVAYGLTYKERGPQVARDLLKRIFDFRRITHLRWLAVVILLPVVIFTLVYLMLAIIGKPLPASWDIAFGTIPFLFVFFFVGALCEEVGYMGYVYQPLERRWGALSAALVIGLPWAVWHYPSMLAQGRNFTWILWGTLGTIAIRVTIVWIYKNTGASLFACILFHALYNLGRVLFPQDTQVNPLVDYPAVHYGVIAVIAMVIALLYGKALSVKEPVRFWKNLSQSGV